MFALIETNRPPGLKLMYRAHPVSSDAQAWDVSIQKWKLLERLCEQGKRVDDGGIQTCGYCALNFIGMRRSAKSVLTGR